MDFSISEQPDHKRYMISEVGDPVTYSVGADRYTGTVTSIKGRTLEVNLDHDMGKKVFTRRKNGLWYEKGRLHADQKNLKLGTDPFYCMDV